MLEFVDVEMSRMMSTSVLKTPKSYWCNMSTWIEWYGFPHFVLPPLRPHNVHHHRKQIESNVDEQLFLKTKKIDVICEFEIFHRLSANLDGMYWKLSGHLLSILFFWCQYCFHNCLHFLFSHIRKFLMNLLQRISWAQSQIACHLAFVGIVSGYDFAPF